MSRPEHIAPPEVFYDEDEAAKYTSNSRMILIQNEMAERCVELLNLPENEPGLLLDLGCGSGLSGEVLSENGHEWIGMDISKDMLDVAVEREVDGDVLLSDLGQGLAFRTGVFDGAISVSMLQWLCNADKTDHSPYRRLMVFFTALYKALRHGSRAVFQFYPENEHQVQMITSQANRAGFTGGLVIDFPESSRRKKVYLCLMCGPQQRLPSALGASEDNGSGLSVRYDGSRKKLNQYKKNKRNAGLSFKERTELIVKSKDKRRRAGKDVPLDSKYTGRKRRKNRF